jgi:hypothetical protein
MKILMIFDLSQLTATKWICYCANDWGIKPKAKQEKFHLNACSGDVVQQHWYQ